jgi:diacylglycerol kinase family enzyme
MKYLLILNPGSKGGSSNRKFKTLYQLLDREGIQYDIQVTGCLEDAYAYSVAGNKKRYDVIVAVGGDGTINRISRARFAVVYTGTSPDFCKSYGIPIDMAKAVHAVAQGSHRPIKIGQLVCAKAIASKANPRDTVTRFFGCCANIGLGPLLADKANSGIRKWMGDFLGTFLSLLHTLVIYKPTRFSVTLDGKKLVMERLVNLSIGRTFHIASGIKVAHRLTDADDVFYALGIRNMKLWHLPKVFYAIYSGKPIVNDAVVSLAYATSLEIHGNDRYPSIEIDGDRFGYLPCKIKMAAQPLDVIYEP